MKTWLEKVQEEITAIKSGVSLIDDTPFSVEQAAQTIGKLVEPLLEGVSNELLNGEGALNSRAPDGPYANDYRWRLTWGPPNDRGFIRIGFRVDQENLSEPVLEVTAFCEKCCRTEVVPADEFALKMCLSRLLIKGARHHPNLW